jgi:hypothetical protein
MRYILFLIILSFFSCNNERILQLPEIENAEVTEVLDVSPAYIFYDETQPDSTLLNRKNLISTTNWLVNVDKRLTLKQAIPHIKFLQDKKRNAEVHKNENAKNYFTCNDTSIGNLGFLEFTDVYYDLSEIEKEGTDFLVSSTTELDNQLSSSERFLKMPLNIDNSNKATFKNDILSVIQLKEASHELNENLALKGFMFILYFDKELSFQDYISIKSQLLEFNLESVEFSNEEFIY